MDIRTLLATAVVATLAAVSSSCQEKPTPQKVVQEAAAPTAKAPVVNTAMLALFKALPAKNESPENPGTPDKVNLGKMLFFDARISRGQSLSCNSCHHLDHAGTDGLALSKGQGGKVLGRNTPPLVDGSVQTKQFWDARADTVEQAVGMVLKDPAVMDTDDKRLDAVLTSMPEYVADFKKAFPGEAKPVTLDNTAKALGAFLRTLLYRSSWDKYLEGDQSALTDTQTAGLATFLDTGCETCHQGPGVGGSMVQKLGLIKPWPNLKDEGLYGVTKQDADKGKFKVAMLRNITDTGPYLHDGSQKSLEQTVMMMAEYQLGKNISAKQARSIVAFLGSMTAEPPADVTKAPTLPKSTAKTPKPAPRAETAATATKLPG